MPPFKTGVTKEHKRGGYPRMSCGPCCNKFVHVLVAEARLGRKLHKWETIHHKDGNVRNPAWTNLLVIDIRTHGAVSSRQWYYLRRKFKAEEAAWKAFLDVTGKTYSEWEIDETLQMRGVSESCGEDGYGDTSFVPEMLGSESCHEASAGD